MIDRGVPADRDSWPTGILDALRHWEQGDIVSNPPFLYFADPKRPVWDATRSYSETSAGPEVILPDEELCPRYGMVTTQTCDIAEEDARRPLRPWVQIAPVYEVTDWKKKKLERRSPMYWVLVPDLPGSHPWVADLRIEVPVEKGWLGQQERIEGFHDEGKKRSVGDKVSRLRGRHAFSRELNALVASVWDFLQSDGDDTDAHQRTANAIEEVGLSLDSYLEPTRAQVVFLTTTSLDEDGIELLRQWNDGQSRVLHEAGVTLQAMDVRELDSLSAAEYRRLAVIWRA
jgi:hypothetical protein